MKNCGSIPTCATPVRVPQDLHVHTVFSAGDTAISPQQTMDTVARFRPAEVQGVSDHLDFLVDGAFERYRSEALAHGLHVGVEVDGADWIEAAEQVEVEYYIMHCYDDAASYRGAERLLATGRPVIIAHPLVLGTDLSRVPGECLVEINNRYVWRGDWRSGYAPYLDRFDFVIGSDAHQPNWLNQNIARWVALELGVEEKLLFLSARS